MKTCIKCGIEKEESEFYWLKDRGKYRGQCKECFKELKRKYRKTEKWRAVQCKSRKRPINKIKKKLLERLRRFIIRGSDTKLNRETMGCTRDFLRARYESLFKPGMTWENYGEWENDHIKEMSKFDLENEETWKECMHYSNLQPQWKTLNLRNIH